MSFIVIDGPNGAGKTTIVKRLGNAGAVAFSSPAGTQLSSLLRAPARGSTGWEHLGKTTQFLLFSAARLDEYEKIVEAPENRDKLVVCDRWWTSTYVYQCLEGNIPVAFMENTIHPREAITLVILLDADDDVLAERVAAERRANAEHGKCSWTNDLDMMRRINRYYRDDLPRYLASRKTIVVTIDTTDKTPDEVFEEVVDLSVLAGGGRANCTKWGLHA